jgi:putative DNA primase/helicase
MADMTDFNDAQGVGLADDIDAIQAEEEARAVALQEAKVIVDAVEDPGAWFEGKTLEALTLLYVNSRPDYERAIFNARRAKVSLGDLKKQVKERARIFIFAQANSKTGVTGVTGVTVNANAGSNGNTEKSEGVTGVTRIAFPGENERPCYQVYDNPIEFQGREYRSGVYYHGIKDTREGPQLFDLWICGPLHVDADLCTRAGTDFGLMLRFMNRRGIWRQWAMPMELLKGSGEELRGELLNLGLNIEIPNRDYLSSYLSSRKTSHRLKSALTVGWHDKAFVLPERVIGDENVFFQSEHAWQSGYAERGTLEEWRSKIAARCVGNPLMTFDVSAAFAGCLLELVHMDGGGFHHFGVSSQGKTTSVRVGCSVWGGPDYMRSWRSTANGIEAAAVLFNDGMLCLDELGQAEPWEVNQVIYFLANGQGKQRANRYGTARRIHRWRVIVLSTGEHSIETHLEQKRIQPKAGQSVRLVNIPTFGKYGAISNLHGCATGCKFSDMMQTLAQEYYGTAGPAFLKWLVQTTPDIGEPLEKTMQFFNADRLTGQEARVTRRFALVALAGELATEANITGWGKGTALSAALNCFNQWRSYRGAGDLERLKVLQAISEFVERHGDSRFSRTGAIDDFIVRDRAGYWRDSANDEREYLFNSAGLHEALRGFEFKRGLEILKEAEWLKPGKDGKSSIQDKASGINARYYLVSVRTVDDEAIPVTPVTPGKKAGVTKNPPEKQSGNTGNTGNTENKNDPPEKENARASLLSNDEYWDSLVKSLSYGADGSPENPTPSPEDGDSETNVIDGPV